MKIIAHTKYGVFESKDTESTEQELELMRYLLEKLANSELKYFIIDTNTGKIYFNEKMIADSLFVLEV